MRAVFLRRLLLVLVVTAVAVVELGPRVAAQQPPGSAVSGSATITTAGGTAQTPGQLYGQNVCTIDVSGTWSGTLQAQASTQWANAQVTPLNSSTPQTGITANGVYFFFGAVNQFRVTGPVGSGSAVVYVTCVYLPGISGSGGTVAVSSLPPVTIASLPPITIGAPTDAAGNVKVVPQETPTRYATVAPNVLVVAGTSSALQQNSAGQLLAGQGVGASAGAAWAFYLAAVTGNGLATPSAMPSLGTPADVTTGAGLHILFAYPFVNASTTQALVAVYPTAAAGVSVGTTVPIAEAPCPAPTNGSTAQSCYVLVPVMGLPVGSGHFSVGATTGDPLRGGIATPGPGVIGFPSYL